MLSTDLELLRVAAKALIEFKQMYGIESATFNLAQSAIDEVIYNNN